MNIDITTEICSLVVTTRSRDEIERYLYDHTKVVEKVEGEDVGNAYILRTEISRAYNVDGDWNVGVMQQYGDTLHLAHYLSDRFASGLISMRVIGSMRDAREALIDSLTK